MISNIDPEDRATPITMEGVHQQEFRIRDLSTRSVLLFPTRAQIIRDIRNIELQVSTVISSSAT
jgi:hypothetical protein